MATCHYYEWHKFCVYQGSVSIVLLTQLDRGVMTEAWDEIVTEALRVMLSIPDIIDYYWPIVQIELSDHQLRSVQYRTTQQAPKDGNTIESFNGYC